MYVSPGLPQKTEARILNQVLLTPRQLTFSELVSNLGEAYRDENEQRQKAGLDADRYFGNNSRCRRGRVHREDGLANHRQSMSKSARYGPI